MWLQTLHLVECSVCCQDAIPSSSEEGALHFHITLGLAHYVADGATMFSRDLITFRISVFNSEHSSLRGPDKPEGLQGMVTKDGKGTRNYIQCRRQEWSGTLAWREGSFLGEAVEGRRESCPQSKGWCVTVKLAFTWGVP